MVQPFGNLPQLSDPGVGSALSAASSGIGNLLGLKGKRETNTQSMLNQLLQTSGQFGLQKMKDDAALERLLKEQELEGALQSALVDDKLAFLLASQGQQVQPSPGQEVMGPEITASTEDVPSLQAESIIPGHPPGPKIFPTIQPDEQGTFNLGATAQEQAPVPASPTGINLDPNVLRSVVAHTVAGDSVTAFKILKAHGGTPADFAALQKAQRDARVGIATEEADISKTLADAQKAGIDVGSAQLDLESKEQEKQERLRVNQFIFGNPEGKISSETVKQPAIAVDRVGQPIEGLELTPDLINRRKIFTDAAKSTGTLMKDAIGVIEATDQLMNEYVLVVNSAVNARLKGIDLSKEFNIQVTKTQDGIIRTYSSSNPDPDVQALIRYANSLPALATPVAKAAGEDRLTNEDIQRFLNIMGDPDLSADQLFDQSRFFLQKIARQGAKVAGVVGDQRYTQFSEIHEELTGQPVTFKKVSGRLMVDKTFKPPSRRRSDQVNKPLF